MGKVLFFGYGANRNRERIKKIIGKEPQGGYGAVLSGYQLTYQVLDQVPEPSREILEKVWGTAFKGYTIRKGSGQVAGVVWELDEHDLDKIKEWEFVDDEWKEVVKTQVEASDGRVISVVTEKAVDTLPIKEVVDGLQYEDNLNAEIAVSREEDDEYRMETMLKIRKELEGFGFQPAKA